MTPNTFHTRHRLHQTLYAYDTTQPLISDTLYTRPGTPGAFDTGNFVHQAPFARNTLYTRHCLHPTVCHQKPFTPSNHAPPFNARHVLHQTPFTPVTPFVYTNTCATHIPKMQRRPRTTSTSDRPRRARTLPHTSHKRPRLRRKMRAGKRARTRPSVNATRPTQNGALPCDGGPRIPREVSMLTATEIERHAPHIGGRVAWTAQ